MGGFYPIPSRRRLLDNDLGQVLDRKVFKDDVWRRAGAPIISDPTSNIAFVGVSDSGGGPNQAFFFAGIGVKAGTALGPVKGMYLDVAYYPYYINRITETSVHAEAGFRLVHGIPTGIWDFHAVHSGIKSFSGSQFTRDNVGFMMIDGYNVDGIRAGFRVDSNDCSGNVVMVGGHPVINIVDHNSGYVLAATCTDMDQYNLVNASINMTLGLGQHPEATVTHGDNMTFGMGNDFPTHGRSVFVFAWDEVGADATSRVIAALGNWDTSLNEALADWVNALSPARLMWERLPYCVQYAGLMSVQQILANEWDGFLCPGVNSWYNNFLRDTSYCAYALASVLPLKARALMAWFADAESLTGRNQYYANKMTVPFNYHNTDNAAIFLLACGAVYQNTRDAAFATSMKSQMDRALAYAVDNYNVVDKHILARHVHDYWDDYATSHIDTALVKYESLIDVMWIAALESVVMVYAALSDSARASVCISMAEGLRGGLEDYRRADGSLHYAIKVDGTLYSTVEALPGTLYAAWLLNDEQSAQYLSCRSKDFGPMRMAFPFGLFFSKSASAIGSDHGWLPHAGLQALVAAKRGDLLPAFWLCDQFKTGAWPEYGQSRDMDSGRLSWYSHAISFPWTNASIIEMVNGLTKLR